MAFLGRKRTRQSDRDQVIDALASAYADGQIDEHEHGLRVSRALRAEELQTLRAQIYDLQVPEDHPAAALLELRRAPAPLSAEPADGARSRRRAGWGVAAGAGLLAASIAVGVVADRSGDGDDELELLTVGCLEDMIEDIEEEFGSAEVVSVEVHDTWAWVRVPAEAGGGRFDLYTYSEDGFSQHQGGTLADTEPDLVDLGDLDLSRLVAHVEAAPERLGMGGEVETVVDVTDSYASTHFASIVHGAEGEIPSHVEIILTNDYMETASLTTDLQGETVLHERPLAQREDARP